MDYQRRKFVKRVVEREERGIARHFQDWLMKFKIQYSAGLLRGRLLV